MYIQTEKTPNPSTLKFIPGRTVLNKSTAFFKSRDEAISSPFAQRLFKVEGIKSVFFGSDFITISKVKRFSNHSNFKKTMNLN